MTLRSLLSTVAVLVAFVAPALSGVPPQFVEVAGPAGIAQVQHVPVPAAQCLFGVCEIERMSGGAAVGDIDGDGDLDLFVTRFYAADILYSNDGDGTFTDVTAASGLGVGGLQSNGAGFADVDNDGDQDLYVTVIGAAGDPPHNRFALWINDGSGVFTEEAVARGCAQASGAPHRGFSVAFGDYDRDGWVDVHTTEWNSLTPSNARLLRNLGGLGSPGYFADATNGAGVSLAFLFSFASALVDLDDDSWPDLAIASDFGTSRLYWSDGDGTFTDGTLMAGVATDENGMGSTFGDVDGDGLLDWFVTSIYEDPQSCPTCNWGTTGNRLYRNLGGRRFEDFTDQAGVREGGWGWGTAFFDFDNDRDLDLVMTNGMEVQGSANEDAFNADPMRLWENDGTGVMTEISSIVGVTDTGPGKGLLVADYDDDGDVDMLVINNGGLPSLYRNDGGNVNGWLRVRTVGSQSNRDGYGARVVLHEGAGLAPQIRQIGASTHFLGQSERVAHFGVGQGAAPLERVTVRWPSGLMQGFDDVSRNTTLIADEASCLDVDADLRCGTLDCNDADPAVWVNGVEINDGIDNQCPGEPGYGVADEIAGAGFPLAGDDATLRWDEQPGATEYEVRRSGSPLFDDGPCAGGLTTDAEWVDPANPAPGALFHYVVRATQPFSGSWGARSDLGERSGICE